jgi:multidrug efflux pump subunit AcrB
VLVEVRMPEGTSIETTTQSVAKVEALAEAAAEAEIVTSYVGQGAPRFFLALAPELPDPAFAKIVVLTPERDGARGLKHGCGRLSPKGLAPEAQVRATQLVFGPYTPFPVEFRVVGPDLDELRGSPIRRWPSCEATRRPPGEPRLGQSHRHCASCRTRTGCA